MWKCVDPTVSYLADVGFNVIRLPRPDLRPGDVLAGTGAELTRIGNATQIWPSSEPLAVSDPVPAALLRGKQTEAFDVKVGVSVLGSLLSPLGVSVPKVQTALSRAETVAFGFGDPRVWAVTPLALGEYLAAAGPAPANPAVDAFVTGGSHHTHLVTDLLVSSSMTVTVTHAASTGAEVDVAVLEGAVDANVQVLSKDDREMVIEFSGTEMLAFGFRSIEFEVVDGAVTMRKFSKPGKVFGAAPPAPSTWASSFPLAEVTIADAVSASGPPGEQ